MGEMLPGVIGMDGHCEGDRPRCCDGFDMYRTAFSYKISSYHLESG
jgi:hypothetical protein